MHTTFKEHIKEAAMQDLEYKTLWKQAKNPDNNKQQLRYEVNQEGMLIYKGRMYVPN